VDLTDVGTVAGASQIIQTVAGGGPNNIPATSANVNGPAAVVKDNLGNLFIVAQSANRVYKVDASGVLTIAAGNGVGGFSGDGGPATSANLASPSGIAVDASGNLFIADQSNGRIRRVDAATGVINTVAGNGGFSFSGDGGPATSASLYFPTGIAVDSSGNLFIADTFNNRVREVAASTGFINTVAGNGIATFSGDGGPATSASLSGPIGVAVDSSGNLFIADTNNQRIREVAAGVINTVAGNGIATFSGDGGPATSASLLYPYGVAVDASGNLFIADTDNERIREVAAGVINTVAGNGTAGFGGDSGPATSASLNYPYGLAVDASGNLFIADTSNNFIREVAASTGIINTVAGNGTQLFGGDGSPATSASLNSPEELTLDGSGNLFISDGRNNRIRRVDASTSIITTVAGGGPCCALGDGGPATSANLNLGNAAGVAVDTSGNVFIADSNNQRIREVAALTGIITTVAGGALCCALGDGGPATSAYL
jgi:sugar lactone lactonase YvrE